MYPRRTFLAGLAGAGAALLAPQLKRNPWLAAAERVRDKIRITEIERHEIYLPYHKFNAQDLFKYHGYRIQANTVRRRRWRQRPFKLRTPLREHVGG